MITSQEIIDKHFDKSKMFGYRPDEVDDFLDSIVKTIQDLENENQTLQRKVQVLNEKLEEYREDEESLRTALVGAQKLGNSMVQEAHQKADAIVKEANYQAEQILFNARRKEESQREGLEQIKQEVSDFKSRLINIYRQHIELIRELPANEPDLSDPQPQQEAQSASPAENAVPSDKIAESGQVAVEEDSHVETETSQQEQPSTGFQISFDRFEKDYPEDAQEEESATASHVSSRYDKTGDSFSALNKDSKFGQLKFGAGYEISRDNERKKKR